MGTTTQQDVSTQNKTAVSDFVWYELQTTDARAAEDFYTHVLGWKAEASGDPGGLPYRLFTVRGLQAAGMLQLTPEMLAGA